MGLCKYGCHDACQATCLFRAANLRVWHRQAARYPTSQLLPVNLSLADSSHLCPAQAVQRTATSYQGNVKDWYQEIGIKRNWKTYWASRPSATQRYSEINCICWMRYTPFEEEEEEVRVTLHVFLSQEKLCNSTIDPGLQSLWRSIKWLWKLRKFVPDVPDFAFLFLMEVLRFQRRPTVIDRYVQLAMERSAFCSTSVKSWFICWTTKFRSSHESQQNAKDKSRWQMWTTLSLCRLCTDL